MWTSFGTMLLFALGMKCLVTAQTGNSLTGGQSNQQQSLCQDATEDSYLRPDPQNCSQFYSCVPQTYGREDLDYLAILLACPPGLLFNPVIQVCDYSYNVSCYTSGGTYPYNNNNNNVANNNNNNNINSGGNNGDTINQNSNSGDNVAIINNTTINDEHTNIENDNSNNQNINTAFNSNNNEGSVPSYILGGGGQQVSTLDGPA